MHVRFLHCYTRTKCKKTYLGSHQISLVYLTNTQIKKPNSYDLAINCPLNERMYIY